MCVLLPRLVLDLQTAKGHKTGVLSLWFTLVLADFKGTSLFFPEEGPQDSWDAALAQ